jgi:hypothetical protein
MSDLLSRLAARPQEAVATAKEETVVENMKNPAAAQEATPAPVEHKGPVYKPGIGLHRLILTRGQKLEKAKDGLFYPTTKEEIAALDYFVSKGRAEKIK